MDIVHKTTSTSVWRSGKFTTVTSMFDDRWATEKQAGVRTGIALGTSLTPILHDVGVFRAYVHKDGSKSEPSKHGAFKVPPSWMDITDELKAAKIYVAYSRNVAFGLKDSAAVFLYVGLQDRTLTRGLQRPERNYYAITISCLKSGRFSARFKKFTNLSKLDKYMDTIKHRMSDFILA